MFARGPHRPRLHANSCRNDIVPEEFRDLFDCNTSHAHELPNFMAIGKPYVCRMRQNSWQSKVPRMENSAPFSDIAERIRWHRATTGMNQTDYAKRAGIKRSQLSNWETGHQRISIDGARALRKTYGLSLDFIYEGIADTLPMTLRNAWLDRPSVN